MGLIGISYLTVGLWSLTVRAFKRCCKGAYYWRGFMLVFFSLKCLQHVLISWILIYHLPAFLLLLFWVTFLALLDWGTRRGVLGLRQKYKSTFHVEPKTQFERALFPQALTKLVQQHHLFCKNHISSSQQRLQLDLEIQEGFIEERR